MGIEILQSKIQGFFVGRTSSQFFVGLYLSPTSIVEIPVGEPMTTIVADDRFPLAIQVGLELNHKLDNPAVVFGKEDTSAVIAVVLNLE